MNTLTTSETEAILTLCIIASFADGDKHDREREQLKKITGSLAGDGVDLTALYQRVLLHKPDVDEVAAQIATPEARQLAYEMAVCVCDADDVCNAAEQQFLDRLRTALALPAASTQPVEAEAAALATLPVTAPAPAQSEETDAMILRYAIVGGALVYESPPLGANRVFRDKPGGPVVDYLGPFPSIGTLEQPCRGIDPR
jgi:tellurite resistance protein